MHKSLLRYMDAPRRHDGARKGSTEGDVLSAGHFWWLAIAACLVTVYLSMVPFHFRSIPFAEAAERFKSMGFGGLDAVGPRSDWVATIVQFAVVSFLLMAALSVDTPRSVAAGGAVIVVVVCSVLAIVVEFLQIYFPPRTVSWNDILLSSLGGAVGVFTWLAAGQRCVDWCRRVWKIRDFAKFARCLLPGYIVVFVLLELTPFDFVIGLRELDIKFQTGKVWLVPFAYRPAALEMISGTITNCLLFLPFGFLKFVSLVEKNADRPWYRLLRFGLGIAVLVEFAQFFVISRFVDTTDVVTGTAAVLMGGWLAQAWLTRKLEKPMRTFAEEEDVRRWYAAIGIGAFAIWLAIAIGVSWYPFNFSTDPLSYSQIADGNTPIGLERMYWFPVADYYWGSKYHAFQQFTLKSMLFLPLGIMLAIAIGPARRRFDHLKVFGAAFVLGAVNEIGQCFLPGGMPSTTDIFIYGFAGWLGFAATQRIAFMLQHSGIRERRVREFSC